MNGKKRITEDCTLSPRKAGNWHFSASAIDISQKFIVNILHDDFHFKAYEYQQWHKDHDYKKEPILSISSFRYLKMSNIFLYVVIKPILT